MSKARIQTPMMEWKDLPWRKLERKVFKLQKRIFKAWQRGDVKAVRNLQKTLMRSWAAKCLATRRVTQDNQGKKTAGIDPLLANIALHGMETHLEKLRTTSNLRKKPPALIRYADDFVILHEDLTVVQRCQQLISEWLQDMDLELKESKTHLTHTLNEHETKIGFKFLGFHIRQYPVGKYKTGKCNGKPLGFKTLIKPSDEKIQLHTKRVGDIIQAHKSAHQRTLIKSLNPIIRGWANYFSTGCSGKIFGQLDNILFKQLKAWCNYRHPQKSLNWIARKYWHTNGNDNYSFQIQEEGEKLRLLKHGEVAIKRHIKVQGSRSPYDGDWIYWSTRLGRHPEIKAREALLLKQQKGKCLHCGLFFKMGDLLETDHITPRTLEGKDSRTNWQLLHRHCHDKKTSQDGSNEKESTLHMKS